MEPYRETLELGAGAPVAGWERRFQVVVAPTGEAARCFAATEGAGSAWISRAEAVTLVDFLAAWLEQTPRA